MLPHVRILDNNDVTLRHYIGEVVRVQARAENFLTLECYLGTEFTGVPIDLVEQVLYVGEEELLLEGGRIIGLYKGNLFYSKPVTSISSVPLIVYDKLKFTKLVRKGLLCSKE